jgi:elongation factor P hydroxylase
MIDPLSLRIAAVFNRCFARTHRTIMVGGGGEPIYRPGSTSQCAEIVFNRDYAASALHEAAHWCIAAGPRRRLVDYGYCYSPPPRSVAEQAEFLVAEANNQGLESLFAASIGMPFRVSTDDFTMSTDATAQFESLVHAHARRWQASRLRGRAARFRDALAQEFRHG